MASPVDPALVTTLEFLTRSNPTLNYFSNANGFVTAREDWLPIKGIRPWEDFTYEILCRRFKTSLNKFIIPDYPTQSIRQGSLDEIAGEDTVQALVAINNLVPVSNAFHQFKRGLAFRKGSRFFRRQSDGLPDWGLGTAEKLNDGLKTLRNLCPGDVKVSTEWNCEDLLSINWSNYLSSRDLRNHARPLEQIQNYSLSLDSRYGWLLTDHALVVIRITQSVDEPPSPAQNPAPLEIARIPWTAKGTQMTINLALYFLARLAYEDCSISSLYPPLDLQLSEISK